MDASLLIGCDKLQVRKHYRPVGTAGFGGRWAGLGDSPVSSVAFDPSPALRSFSFSNWRNFASRAAILLSVLRGTFQPTNKGARKGGGERELGWKTYRWGLLGVLMSESAVVLTSCGRDREEVEKSGAFIKRGHSVRYPPTHSMMIPPENYGEGQHTWFAYVIDIFLPRTNF